MALQDAINTARLEVWGCQSSSFFAQTAVIDAERKEGMDIGYNGLWGYSALLVSLANTKEPSVLQLLRRQPAEP